jgi:hypothetical protein
LAFLYFEKMRVEAIFTAQKFIDQHRFGANSQNSSCRGIMLSVENVNERDQLSANPWFHGLSVFLIWQLLTGDRMYSAF